MGPIFNPVYWVFGVAILVGALLVAGALGGISFGISTKLAKAKKETSTSIGIFVVALVFIITFCGLCNLSLSDPSLPVKKPSTDNIVGIWEPTEMSLQSMSEEGNYEISTHTIEFKDDGTFKMVNMPDWWVNSFGESTGGFYSGNGTWEISKRQSAWEIVLDFNTLTNYPNGLITSFLLRGRKPPYNITIFLGDPDSFDVFVFERKN